MKLRDSLVVALGLLVPFTAQAATSVGVSINIGNAPPPPAMVVREEPELVLVPNSSVYVCDDDRIGYDTFRYGVYWYIYNDGYWYRAHRWGGPFRAIEVRYVPRPIWAVPERRWHHHPHGGPPGLVKKGWVGDDREVVVEKRGHGHGHGRGRWPD
ncbi:MAG: hypothetical protein E6K80_01445 [Candidatus Eisenbacteria bacterium]|uniref:DUF3300 domain-containing protein n=1 Tax=Eiseniibacteriota bacterium TaxID=2212470 RepID=A0A538UAI2_UNCEI|nr:MAG: hypothetical protein E6K80_01445 [Candidatus Eisenbacteria bacterium]